MLNLACFHVLLLPCFSIKETWSFLIRYLWTLLYCFIFFYHLMLKLRSPALCQICTILLTSLPTLSWNLLDTVFNHGIQVTSSYVWCQGMYLPSILVPLPLNLNSLNLKNQYFHPHNKPICFHFLMFSS